MANWKIHVLGEDAAMLIGGRRFHMPEIGWAIFGCLIASPHRSINRLRLASELWPDSTEEAARHCLASALWRIKRRLPCFDTFITSHGDHLMLKGHRSIWIDAAVLERRAVRALSDSTWLSNCANRQKMKRTLNLYRGEFLARQDRDMIMIERERLRALYLDASFHLAHVNAQHGEWHDAADICRDLCAVEPLREDAQRLLIQAYAACGNRPLAIQQYNDLQKLLLNELAVEPMRETREVVDRIARTPNVATTHSDLFGRAVLVQAREQMMQTIGLIDQALTQIPS